MSNDKSEAATGFDGLLTGAKLVLRRDFLVAAATVTAAGVVPQVAALARPAATKASGEYKGNAQDRAHMTEAIRLMGQAGIVDKTGGPFGAVIARGSEVLSASGNSVLRDNDPSAHAEVNAIRIACKKIGAPNLKGATLYTSCEPCPMCYATAYWARLLWRAARSRAGQ